MKRTAVAALAAVMLILCLSGCSMKPHSARQVTRYLENLYNAPGRFELMEELGEGRFLYHDLELDIDFGATSSTYGWGQNAIVPIPHREITSGLEQGIRYAHREEALALAEGYGLTLRVVSDLFVNNSDAEAIFVSSYDELEDAAALLFALYRLYWPEDDEHSAGKVFFYYLENPAEGTSRIIMDLSYSELRASSHFVYENEAALAEKLQQKWMANAQIPSPE